MGSGEVISQAVFLDRDGVLIRAMVRDGKPYPPNRLEEVQVIEGVQYALVQLKQANFLLIVVTNQPDVARGTQRKEEVERINRYLFQTFPLDDILVCYHDEQDRCLCRKPRPGLILEGQQRFGIDLKNSFMVGDRWRDVAAGQNAGCTSIFIDYGYAERKPDLPYHSALSLMDSLKYILSKD